MTVFTERAAIRERMTDIKEEKKRLNEEYYVLLDRLRTLDTQETEAIDTESVVGSLTDALRLLKELIPNIPTDVLITNLADKVKESGVQIQAELEETPIVPEYIVAEQKYRDAQRQLHERTPGKKNNSKYLNKSDSGRLSDAIVALLKEKGIPTKLGELQDEIEQEFGPISGAAFHARMNTIMKNNSKVEKVMRGVYQYKF